MVYRKFIENLRAFAHSPMVPLWAGVLLLLGIVAEAAARTGGGQNYSGGGGSSGGGGGGGGGGDGIGFIIYLMIRHPKIGVPVAIIAIAVYAVRHRMNPDNTTKRSVRELEAQGASRNTDLSAIQERDPQFDPEQFLNTVRQIEQKVQGAWSDGNMGAVRGYLSDGLLRGLSTQLRVMKSNGIKNVLADHRVLDARILAVVEDESFDTIHVGIEAEARDVEVDDKLSSEAALKKAKGARLEKYVEVWSFLRKPGAQTVADGVLQGRCPNCGADLDVAQATRCTHCQALVNSGEYDWVLAEITQEEEWRLSSSGGTIPGLASANQRDLGFNRQVAEDRGAYLFWRWVETLVLGKIDPLSKCASVGFKDEMKALVNVGPTPIYKVAVGSVDLVAVELFGERERFHVKVMWSSARGQKEPVSPMVNVLTVGRKVVQKGTESGFSYARCSECQAPLKENDSPSCEYCGTRLDAGDRDWVLEQVRQPEELVLTPSAETELDPQPLMVPDMGNARERTLLLMRMAAVVVADGVVTKEERKLLKTAAKRWSVPFNAVVPILEGNVPVESALTMRPANPMGFLSGLVAAALVDGRIDKKEDRLLMDVAKSMEIDEQTARQLMASMAQEKRARG